MQLVLIVVGVLLALVLGWMAYCFVKLGFPERLGLLFGGLASIDKIVDQSAARYGDTTLIELETPLKWKVPAGKVRAAQEQEWSAVRVQQTVALIAGALKKFAKPQMGDRVIIYKENAFDLFLFASATIRIGGIATPVNGKLASESFGQYVTYLGAKVIITDLATLGRLVKDGVKLQGVEFVIVSDAGTDGQDGIPTELAQLPAGPRVLSLQWMLAQPVEPAQAVERGLDDPLYIVHTSGTTGFPKGVILLARGLTQSLKATLMFNLVGRKDLAYFCVPFNHQVTNLYIFTTLALGTRVIMSSEFKAERVLETLSRRRASIYFGFPITYAQLVVEDLTKYDLNAMRIWGTTADASHEVHQRPLIQKGSFLQQLGIPVPGSLFVDGLGSSEVGIAALLRIAGPWTKQFGRRVGRPVPFFGPQVRVVDENWQPVPDGQPGRFAIKGPCMFGGYWNAHDKLLSSSQNGWWFTGDIVIRQPDGEFVHLDREVDVISHQQGVSYTLLMEEEVLKHPAVFDTTVFALTQADGKVVPAAAVALKNGADSMDAERLRLELNAKLPEKDRLAELKVTRWSEFPIGVTGKTLKRVFRAGS
ncbi:class I adenylate-forming enzyme family protein [Stigmatella aurantiaca]|uniref:AMP-dependent synthetase and ligase n=1 Tax=Stigmatella aurantiaca (strain DW4/3-1) TaxID=378806 RepID=E3FWX1_STIAD|nr:class I adenylate-forming enzyme family protein [Stigmatella aurantiaca]ADO71022.1 AMP-dependent synthetase and ligase [Stigmatella aurantiaca DW4/3-1]